MVKITKQLSGMELYSEADKTIWEEKYMPVSLKKGTEGQSYKRVNPGLKNVVVGIGWDINALTQAEISIWMQQRSV